MAHTIKISCFLSNIADAFYGVYDHDIEDLEEIKEEVFDIYHVPHPSHDRKALKEDLNNFLRDTKKAHKSLKEELENG